MAHQSHRASQGGSGAAKRPQWCEALCRARHGRDKSCSFPSLWGQSDGFQEPGAPSGVSARPAGPRCAPLAHSCMPGPVLLLPGKRCGMAVMEH